MNTYTNTVSSALSSAGVNPAIIPNIVGAVLIALIVLIVWTLIWKGFALWHAARNNQPVWFLVLLILNTAGVLEILYLLLFRKNKNDVVHTTTVTHTVTASTPAPDMASSVTPGAPTV
jgi:hypothetical protein